MDEYIRMDDGMSSPYQSMFGSALDARAILGEQIEGGQDNIKWSEMQYVGTPLTDAIVAMSAASDDWGEMGLMWVTDHFSGWALGQYQWNDDGQVLTDESHPYLGCNNDRMTHVPKGVNFSVFKELTIFIEYQHFQRI